MNNLVFTLNSGKRVRVTRLEGGGGNVDHIELEYCNHPQNVTDEDCNEVLQCFFDDLLRELAERKQDHADRLYGEYRDRKLIEGVSKNG